MIPSEQILKLIINGHTQVYLLIDPRVGHRADWPALWDVGREARAALREGKSLDRYADRLNELLEVHSIVQVSTKPFRPAFGEEAGAI